MILSSVCGLASMDGHTLKSPLDHPAGFCNLGQTSNKSPFSDMQGASLLLA
jgi:hypothetical protein